jgi:hypothetical protein
MNPQQKRIWRQITNSAARQCNNSHHWKAVYVNGMRYRSYFEAGIDSGVSYVSISTRLKESSGAPVVIGYSVVVAEEWILKHPEYLGTKK